MRKVGQAGLDFLMTYGWALVIIVLVIGVLFALGIFNVGSFAGNRVAGFTSIGVAAYAFDAGTANLTVKLVNRAGTQVSIEGIACAFETDSFVGCALSVKNTSGTDTLPYSLSSGSATDVLYISTNATGKYKTNDYYSVQLQINYTDLKTNFKYTDSGTISGKAA